ncbi:MAG: hypothetical protein WAO02_04525 [Verrucomicrobiia bacterium]
MKAILSVLLLVGISVFALTNEPVVAVLPVSGQFYTNAQITRVTPAYAVVIYDGGIVQVALSNLPAAYQEKYGYDPEQAARFLADRNQKLQAQHAASMARQAAYSQALAARAGTNRPVQIISILDEMSNGGYPLCAISNIPQGILVNNLTDEVRTFLNRKKQLAADISSFSDKVQADASAAARAQAVAPAFAATDSATVEAQNNQRAQANLMAVSVQEEQEELAKMKSAMSGWDAETPARTTILAFPSGQFYGQYEIWNCVGMP